MFLISTFKSYLGFSISERSGIRKNRWYHDNATSVCKTNLTILTDNPKHTVSDVIRTVVYFIHLEQFFSVVVYANSFTFSSTHKTYGLDSVSKRYYVFLTLYYVFSFCNLY